MPAPRPYRRRRRREQPAALGDAGRLVTGRPTARTEVLPTRDSQRRRRRPRSRGGDRGRNGLYSWNGGPAVHTISQKTHQRHLRERAQDRNPLYDPTEQLAGSDLAGAARDLVNLEFAPQEAALRRELGNVTTQGTALAQRAADYSGQIAANDAGLVAQQAAIGNTLNTQLGANATNAQKAIQQMLDQTRTAAAEDARVRGNVGGDLATAPAATEAQAAAGRVAVQGQASQDAAAASTAAYQQLADLAGRARAQAGVEVQQQLLNRLANAQGDVRARQADLGAQRGEATTKATLDLRQQAFENLITQAGLNIKRDELRAQTAEGQAKLEEQRKARRARTRSAAAERRLRRELDRNAAARKSNEVNKLGYTNAEWLNMSSSERRKAIIDFQRDTTSATARAREDARGAGPSERKPMTQQARDKRSRIESMVSDTRTDRKLIRHVNERGPRLVQILVKRGADPLEAQAAAELARYHYLRPDTIASLRRAGVRIPRNWRRASQGRGSGNNPVQRTGRGDFQ